MRVLYLSYDGALDPLGRSQVLPYLETLSERGHRYALITFEKPDRWADRELRAGISARMASAGIDWRPLPYHGAPPVFSTLRDLHRGVGVARRLARDTAFDLVHVRSYPCVTIARQIKREFGVPYLFDMRGFYAEERVDGGLWRAGGLLYQVTKRLEADFLRGAGAVVTLTEASLPILRRWMEDAHATGSVHVIPTAVDLDRFQPGRVPERPHLMYIGSVGTWYLLPEMVELASSFLAMMPEGQVTFLVNGASEPVRRAISERGMAGVVQVRTVGHDCVPAELRDATATFALIRPSPSKIASSPTKIGESLAAGVPVLVSRGVGDLTEVVAREGVGVSLDPFRRDTYAAALATLFAMAGQDDVRVRCREVATRIFGLDRAADAYEAAYGAARRSLPAGAGA